MRVIVSGKSISLTPSLQTYAEEKFGRLNRYWTDIILIHVELDKNFHHKHGDVFTAGVWVEAPGKDLRVRTEATDMHQAIDLASAKLERMVIRAKDRRTRS